MADPLRKDRNRQTVIVWVSGSIMHRCPSRHEIRPRARVGLVGLGDQRFRRCTAPAVARYEIMSDFEPPFGLSHVPWPLKPSFDAPT